MSWNKVEENRLIYRFENKKESTTKEKNQNSSVYF